MAQTRSSARLRNHTRVIASGVAQMTAADYVQPKCLWCQSAVNDDRCEHGNFGGYCSKACSTLASQRRSGRTHGHGQNSQWREVYAQAQAYPNTWVRVEFESIRQARIFGRNVENKKAFQSSVNGLSVSVRYVVAA